MKYKVGDKVRVRKDLEPGNFYGRIYYGSDMNKFKAMECVVTNIYDGTYNINNSDIWFSDEMLEPVDDLLEYALEKLGITKEELENEMNRDGGDLMDELMERYEKLHQAIRRVSKNRGEYIDDIDMLVDAEEEFSIVFEEFLEGLNN